MPSNGFLSLTIAGREARTWTLQADQIESFKALRWDEVYERDARSEVRTKSGETQKVREDTYLIAQRIQQAQAQAQPTLSRCAKCNGTGKYEFTHGSWGDCPACNGRGQ